jgi:signal transduction histidine kinase
LLTKIENGQYAERSAIDLQQRVTEKIIQCEELTKARKISVQKDIQEEVSLFINPLLADILLNNLFSNAIKYTPAGGTLSVSVSPGLFEIGNTGHGTPLDTRQLFRRFGKPGAATEGVGLGLAIIGQISDISHIPVRYSFKEGAHWFSFAW